MWVSGRIINGARGYSIYSVAESLHGPTSVGLAAPSSGLERGRMRCIFKFGLIKAGIGWPVHGDAGGGGGGA